MVRVVIRAISISTQYRERSVLEAPPSNNRHSPAAQRYDDDSCVPPVSKMHAAVATHVLRTNMMINEQAL